MKKSFRITLAVFSLMSASSMAQEPTQAIQYSGPFAWTQSQPPVNMTPVATSVCFLTKVTGEFSGDGEAVEVKVQGTNWVLTGVSQQKGVGGEAMCLTGISPPKPSN